jgi:hypothetical protein
LTMLVTNDDALVIKADDTRIGDGDTGVSEFLCVRRVQSHSRLGVRL